MRRKKDPIQPLIYRLDRNSELAAAGNKATNIQRLVRLGMRVPQTFVLRWDAYQRYTANDLSVIGQLLAELREKLDARKRYAVRSSANIEDSFEHSFAGQFKTVLNVQGPEALLQAVWSVWATATNPEVHAYLQKRSLDEGALRMALILQEMVTPVFSGVAFSRNPLNGLRETVVEAVEGLGIALVQDGATPFRWTFRNGKFTSQPEGPSLPPKILQEIVTSVRQIARKVKGDIDLEWVYDGENLYWVQMREITSLHDVKIYSDSIAREMLAGIIKPLIWSINIPLKGGVVVRILSELTGRKDLTPEKLIRSFSCRAYFNMGLLGEIFEQLGFPADSLEMMWGLTDGKQEQENGRAQGMKLPHGMPDRSAMLRLMPHMVKFFWDKWKLPAALERRLPELEKSYREIDLQEVASLSPAELLEGIDRLSRLNEEAIYYNIFAPLSMYLYTTLLRKQLKRSGYDFARLDLQQDGQEFLRFNPNDHLKQLNRVFIMLPQEYQEQVRRSSYAEIQTMTHLDGFRSGFERLISDFGHLCDNGNDFSSVPWRETPDTILRLILDFPADSTGGETKKIPFESLRLPWSRRWWIRGLYERTRRFHLYREHISYIYTLGYGLFRVYFLALAKHFAGQDWIDSEEDIYYLTHDEVRVLAGASLSRSELVANLRERISQRREEVEAARNVSLPSVIFGDQPPPARPAFGCVLRGTATSRGYCTGPVKVVSGLQDFAKVQHGDVLVIPFSEVSWTPLFARAAGVIAESGGMLSHSSIVAREYGIPAVVSVAGAMHLSDGACVSIDGYKGEILIHQEDFAAFPVPHIQNTIPLNE